MGHAAVLDWTDREDLVGRSQIVFLLALLGALLSAGVALAMEGSNQRYGAPVGVEAVRQLLSAPAARPSLGWRLWHFVMRYRTWLCVAAGLVSLGLVYLSFSTKSELIRQLVDVFPRGWQGAAISGLAAGPVALFGGVNVVVGLLSRRVRMPPEVALGLRTGPPTVLLRAFETDQTAVVDPDVPIPGGGAAAALLALPYRFPKGLLQVAVEHASAFGPVLALRNPRDERSVPGAGMIVALDAEWQAVVDALLAGSGLVILSVADTPAVRWEASRLGKLAPERPLMLLAPRGPLTPHWPMLRAHLPLPPEPTSPPPGSKPKLEVLVRWPGEVWCLIQGDLRAQTGFMHRFVAPHLRARMDEDPEKRAQYLERVQQGRVRNVSCLEGTPTTGEPTEG